MTPMKVKRKKSSTILEFQTVFPPITIVHEIPQTNPKPLSVKPEQSNLRPEAETFHPTGSQQQGHHMHESLGSCGDGRKMDGLSTDLGEKKEEASLIVEVDDVLQAMPETEHKDEPESVGEENHEELSDERELEGSGVDNVQEQEHTEVRRSTRHRVEPDRLTYQMLGNPLTLVMQSLLKGLDQAFTKALDLNPTIKSIPLEAGHLTTV